MPTELPPVPHNTPVVDRRGVLSSVWSKWLQSAFQRMGGRIAQSNDEISSGAIVDHGALTGLGDDDHTQYHNNARGDARYYTQAQVDAKISDTAYDATSWNSVTTVAPSKNAVRDEIQARFDASTGHDHDGTDSKKIPVGSISATGTPDSTTFLRGDGTWNAPAGSSLVAPTVQKFTSGSGTYTTPANVLYLRVRMVGGGGGGSGSGTASMGNGGAGGNSSFGTSLLTADGGGGGVGGGGSGTGGAASLGTGPIGSAFSGASGTSHDNQGVNYATGGPGGSSPFGGAGGGAIAAAGYSAQANTGSGGGGAGAGAGGTVSGSGGGAGGFVDAVISSPSATYSYAVGAAGTAGTAGTSGFAGGSGAAGYIEVTEYYQ